MNRFSFSPCADQARRVDDAMQASLSESLKYLLTAAPEVFKDCASELRDCCQKMDAGKRAPPTAFGVYYDIVAAIESDAFDQAAAKAQLFIDLLRNDMADIAIVRLGDEPVAGQTELYQRIMGEGNTDASGIRPPSPEAAECTRKKLKEALVWIDDKLPDLSQEFRTLVREIVLVAPDSEDSHAFEGGSSFRLWGALFFNAEHDFSPTELITSLVHEEGHLVLFGLCREETLVANPDSELFWSPIRQAERPMEGIVHATFVSARMSWAISQMEKDSSFGALERRKAEESRRSIEEICREGVEIISQHARLTSTGAQVMEEVSKQALAFSTAA